MFVVVVVVVLATRVTLHKYGGVRLEGEEELRV